MLLLPAIPLDLANQIANRNRNNNHNHNYNHKFAFPRISNSHNISKPKLQAPITKESKQTFSAEYILKSYPNKSYEQCLNYTSVGAGPILRLYALNDETLQSLTDKLPIIDALTCTRNHRIDLLLADLCLISKLITPDLKNEYVPQNK